MYLTFWLIYWLKNLKWTLNSIKICGNFKIPKATHPKRKERLKIKPPTSLNQSSYNPNLTSNPIKETRFKDKKFKDLTFYKPTRSKYWWCRLWVLEKKRYIQMSLKTEDRNEAIKRGREVYNWRFWGMRMVVKEES